MIFFYHEVLKFLNSQQKLSQRHAIWVQFLQTFNFSMKHKFGVHNVIADTLSQSHLLFINMQMEVTCLEVLKDLYKHDDDFDKI